MKVRPSSPEDGPRIAALLADVGLQPGVRLDHLHWKYWQPREDWSGPRSYVMASGEEIIAHGGIVPASLAWDSGRMSAIQMIDWAARPDTGGAGISLMKHIGRLVDGLVSIGGSAQTRVLLPHLGFRSYGDATGYVRALHPLQLLQNDPRVHWRLLPRFLRSAAWRLSAPARVSRGWQSRRIGPEELHLLASVLPTPLRQMAVFERSTGGLRHVLACPIVPMELYVLEHEGQRRGYFLLARARGQSRLSDCWIDSDQAADWRALIQCAVHRAMQQRDAVELVTWSTDPLFSRCLSECGFHARNGQPVKLLLRRGITLPTQSLRVQMLDADAPYLNANRAALWA